MGCSFSLKNFIEYDEHNPGFREYERYQCLILSANGRYCRRWIGETDSEEEFEISTCECLDDIDSDSIDSSAHYCQKWTCYEAGYHYFYPNLIWVLLPVSVCGLFATCFCMCIRDGKIEGLSVVGTLYIIFALLFTWIAAIFAGMVAILLSLGMSIVIFPAALFFYRWNRTLQTGLSSAARLEWWKVPGRRGSSGSEDTFPVGGCGGPRFGGVSSSSCGLHGSSTKGGGGSSCSFIRDTTVSTHRSNQASSNHASSSTHHTRVEEHEGIMMDLEDYDIMAIPVVEAEIVALNDDDHHVTEDDHHHHHRPPPNSQQQEKPTRYQSYVYSYYNIR